MVDWNKPGIFVKQTNIKKPKMSTFTLTRQEENKQVREFILKNKHLTTEEISNLCNLSKVRVGGNIAYLKRSGKYDTKKEVANEITKIEELLVKAQEKISTNTYTGGGANKEIARVKMSNYITDSEVIGNVATLPNTEWDIEKKILKQCPDMTFLGVERDAETYVKMKISKKLNNIKGKTYHGNIGDVLYGKIENTYSHLILDYCGMLPTISKEIEYSIKNDIVEVGGIIAITFGKPIRGNDKQSNNLKKLGQTINNNDDRCMSDRAIEAYFHKITGWNYEVSEFFDYRDTYPMMLVIIKRVK